MNRPAVGEDAAVGTDPVTTEDARLHQAMGVLPYLLLGLSFAGTLAVGGRPVEAGWVPWLTALTALVVCYRVWWQVRCSTQRARIAGFVLNLVVTMVLVSISPLYGLYAFVGYLDAVAAFAGPAQVWALVAAGSLNALAQTGGPDGVVQRPWLFAFLLIANAGLAVVMVQVDRHRQQTVTRMRRALADLQDAREANEALQAQLLDHARDSGVLEERQRLSREIHDTVAQGLIAVLRQIETASEASTLVATRGALDQADQTARDCLAEARRAVSALASPRLDDADLPTALNTLTAGWSDLTGIDSSFRLTGRSVVSPRAADLMRICQEALANVAKHSGATRVDVRLTYDGARIHLDICDDGVGFDPERPTQGHGLRGVRDRLAAVDGSLDLETREGGGCAMRVVVPA